MTHAISPEAIRSCADQLRVATEDAQKALDRFDRLSATGSADDQTLTTVAIANGDNGTSLRDLLQRVVEALKSAQHSLDHQLEPQASDANSTCPTCWNPEPSEKLTAQPV